ncbi:MAG TPA: family 16 glycoside hydrolase [Chthoniobacter sp.]
MGAGARWVCHRARRSRSIHARESGYFRRRGNRFHITMKGDRVTVMLNEKIVIKDVQLPGIPAKGPIGSQDHGDAVEFANVFIKELQP